MYGVILLMNESAYNTTHDAFIICITPQQAQIFCRFLEDWQNWIPLFIQIIRKSPDSALERANA
jgi:hypothetical protein